MSEARSATEVTCQRCGTARVRRIERTEKIRGAPKRDPAKTIVREVNQAYNVCLDCWHREPTY